MSVFKGVLSTGFTVGTFIGRKVWLQKYATLCLETFTLLSGKH